uniref:Uncharacterized protein n=1 Tax=Rhodosorus marinus TaxID=101924 RepID=A0A7S3EQ79_9RHOD|mmetsp:Transcript_9256/g.40505  ORF Transcript_9256/g.40505 Transcript_9256/m.40505 type:complete len:111 (+) Transcript_9256:472-804(+)
MKCLVLLLPDHLRWCGSLRLQRSAFKNTEMVKSTRQRCQHCQPDESQVPIAATGPKLTLTAKRNRKSAEQLDDLEERRQRRNTKRRSPSQFKMKKTEKRKIDTGTATILA